MDCWCDYSDWECALEMRRWSSKQKDRKRCALVVYRTKSSAADPHFLLEELDAQHFRELAMAFAAGGSGLSKSTDLKKLRSCK